MSALFYTHIDDSPVGPLLLAGDSAALHVLAFGVGSRPREIDADWTPDTKGVLSDVRKELDRYFAGKLREFSTRLAFNGTPFQNEIHRVMIAADANRFLLPDEVLAVSVWNAGVEYEFNRLIALRLGYISDPIGTITDATYGLGLTYKGFRFDYASFPQSEFLDRVQRFSASYHF